MDPRLVNLLESFFDAKAAGNIQLATYYWATYIALIRALGPSAIVAVSSGGGAAATGGTIAVVSETTVATMAVSATARSTTRTFIKRLLITMGAAIKPIPPALIVGICVIGALSSAKAAYAESNAISEEPAQYNLYLTNYIRFVAKALSYHPNAQIAPPYIFAEWHENKDSICLPNNN